MDLQISGKVALVTGSNRGIGKATAITLSKEGADVALLARNEKLLSQTKNEISSIAPNIKVEYFLCDTKSNEQVKDTVSKIEKLFGKIDILVNCAAALPEESTLENFQDKKLFEQIEVKVAGYIRCAQNVAPIMKKNGWGRIINISGLNARSSGNLIGSMRNISVSSLTKNLADNLGPYGINVNVIHPGLTYTERSDDGIEKLSKKNNISMDEAKEQILANNSIKKVITAYDIANIVAFLSSPLSKAINGEPIPAGGGQKGFIYY
tara:strand:+ start:1103 stop:1897 length:795 start_codon:yes stop_codon:yes gene_type:complete